MMHIEEDYGRFLMKSTRTTTTHNVRYPNFKGSKFYLVRDMSLMCTQIAVAKLDLYLIQTTHC